jgi:hypothetical protein
MFWSRRKAAGEFERECAESCRKAEAIARLEGDDTHAREMACKAQAWMSKEIEAVRRDREKRAGVYDESW